MEDAPREGINEVIFLEKPEKVPNGTEGEVSERSNSLLAFPSIL